MRNHICIPKKKLYSERAVPDTEASLVFHRYRWSYRGGAAAAPGSVRSERFPLCYAKYKSRPLCAAQHKTTRVQFKVRTSVENETLLRPTGGLVVMRRQKKISMHVDQSQLLLPKLVRRRDLGNRVGVGQK